MSQVFVVAFINFSDNNIILEKVYADSWWKAALEHSKCPYTLQEVIEIRTGLTDEKAQEEFKVQCFDCDTMMEWINIT